MQPSDARSAPGRARELALSLILFAVACGYIGFLWPHTIYDADEGTFLYEAKRVLDGQVMYRDFFDLVGPVSNYLMALIYALFGATMETARLSLAVFHGLIVVLCYAIARRLGVRPMLAAVVSLADPALLFPGLPFTSPHWMSTLLTLVIFLLVLRAPLTGVGRAVVVGLFGGTLLLTQQQKGVPTVAAVGVVLFYDWWVGRRTGGRAIDFSRQAGGLALGFLAVVVPTLAGFVAVAGFEPVFDALVRTPFGPYSNNPNVSGGKWILFTLDLDLLRRLPGMMFLQLGVALTPLIIPVSTLRLVWQARSGVSLRTLRPFFVAVVFSAFSAASVYYLPNYSHFGVVGPVLLSLFAESIETLVRRAEAWLQWRWVGAFASASILVGLTCAAYKSLLLERGAGMAHETAFGNVFFQAQSSYVQVQSLDAILQEAGAKQLFVYPYDAGIYLLTGTSNPTRFQLLLPEYSTPEQYAEVRDILERERVPFVVRGFWWWYNGDPLLPYLQEHYESVKLARKPGTFPTLSLYRRKAG